MKISSYIFAKISDILSPPACAYCHDFLLERSVLCEHCIARVQAIVSAQIALTPAKTMSVYSIGSYQEPLKSLILAKSFGNRVVSKQLGQLVWRLTSVEHYQFDYLVPIPLHWTRYAQRGYNQAEVIASELARLSGKPMKSFLRRVRRTAFQSGLAVLDRGSNVHAAFQLSAPADMIRGKRILLVDDLMTTGSTLKEAAKVLLSAQPESIAAVVVCRVV